MLGMRRATLVLLSFCKVRCLATASSASGSGDLSHESGQVHRLLRVVVIHRHGDRSQIERSAGPKYPESEHVTTSWLSKMPSQEIRELLLRADVFGQHSSLWKFLSTLHSTQKKEEGWFAKLCNGNRRALSDKRKKNYFPTTVSEEVK